MCSYTPQMSLSRARFRWRRQRLSLFARCRSLLCTSLKLKPQHRGLSSGAETALKLGSCSQVVIKRFLAVPSSICVLSPVSVPDSHLEYEVLPRAPPRSSSGSKIPPTSFPEVKLSSQTRWMGAPDAHQSRLPAPSSCAALPSPCYIPHGKHQRKLLNVRGFVLESFTTKLQYGYFGGF